MRELGNSLQKFCTKSVFLSSDHFNPEHPEHSVGFSIAAGFCLNLTFCEIIAIF